MLVEINGGKLCHPQTGAASSLTAPHRNCFKSDKVAEISYASQLTSLGSLRGIGLTPARPSHPREGLSCTEISEQFCHARGSPLSAEGEPLIRYAARPSSTAKYAKLYFTSNGPHPELSGQEEPFPEPDNQSKMKRSCENAEHVGECCPQKSTA